MERLCFGGKVSHFKMYKIGVVGTRESVMCFMASGFETFIADTPESALAGLKKMIGENCAVIFITEEYAAALSEETEKYKDDPIPAIITIPGASGRTGYGMETLRRACERAVGMDLLS